MALTHLSLFSGIGGVDLAAEMAGFTTVGQCEWADYPTKVLEKHWPDVPRWRDIRELTGESFYERTGLRTVDLISGGFPCQPFSVAGNQKGKGDDRYLWPEMLRVIRELTPRWILGENVPGILRIAADDVCADLESENYEIGIFDYEAAAVGAAHRRERIFFVAHATDVQCNAGAKERGAYVADTDRPRPQGRERGSVQERTGECAVGEGGAYVADAEGEQAGGVFEQQFQFNVGDGGERRGQATTRPTQFGMGGTADGLPDWFYSVGMIAGPGESQYPWEPPRVATGIPHRADRLRALGNAVVPQQVYPILAAIAEIIRISN